MQLLLAAGLIVVVAAIAFVVQRRRRVDPPTQTSYQVPSQLDRNDFIAAAAADWIVVTFTSESCQSCADVRRKAAVLASREVAVVDIEYSANRDLHQRYKIDAVPAVVIADREGVVRAGFLGPVSATDLWAACAEARDPGSSPEPELGR